MNAELLAVIPKDLDNHLIVRFNRAMALSEAVNEYISLLVQREEPFEADILETSRFTTSLVRHHVQSTFVDILDYASPQVVLETRAVVQLCEKYQSGQAGAMILPNNERDLLDYIHRFVQDWRGLGYEERFLRPR